MKKDKGRLRMILQCIVLLKVLQEQFLYSDAFCCCVLANEVI